MLRIVPIPDPNLPPMSQMPSDTLSLAEENRRLRAQIEELLEDGRRNQRIMRRHQVFDLKFIGAGSFRELIASIFRELKDSSGLDVITLSLIDADYDIRRILADLDIKLSEFPHLLFLQDASELGESHARMNKPLIGPYSEEEHGPMFPEPIPVPASVVIAPLIRNGELTGTINLGSFRADRFAADMATDFVAHMAAIIAICIENVINNERLKHIGLTDPLTGVNNRRYLERRLLEEVMRSRRHGHALSCMFVDIDHFKQVNDKIGHHAGDEVLREVAARIKAELRSSDAMGRFGGEEFVAVLVDTGLKDALVVAERIRAGIAEPSVMLANGQQLPVTASIGVAALGAADRSARTEAVAQELLAHADQALYRAKSGGRNKVVSAE
jgi:diguanylate cyclase (GGDEF)-like protein